VYARLLRRPPAVLCSMRQHRGGCLINPTMAGILLLSCRMDALCSARCHSERLVRRSFSEGGSEESVPISRARLPNCETATDKLKPQPDEPPPVVVRNSSRGAVAGRPMDGWRGNSRRGFLSYRAVIPTAHFIILDRLVGP